MNVSPTPELEKLIEEKVKSGMYGSASEVVREALRLLKERDDTRALRMQQLRNDVAIGLKQLDNGEAVAADEVFDELRRRSRERRTA